MLELSLNEPEGLAKICHALSTPLRLGIAKQLQDGPQSCLELSKSLEYPFSTIAANVKILEESGLVIANLLPAKNGTKKICSLVFLDIGIHFASERAIPQEIAVYEMQIPIGNYMDFCVEPSCGFVTDHPVCVSDNPDLFVDPSRVQAQLLWFRRGYVEYRVPLKNGIGRSPNALCFGMEICSEAPGFNMKWASDITMWINDIEIGAWTSPSDFGDRRGILTPAFWSLGNTQYGVWTEWRIDAFGSSVNGQSLSSVSISDLHLSAYPFVYMRIGVKADSPRAGGINLFGAAFGDYPHHITMTLY